MRQLSGQGWYQRMITPVPSITRPAPATKAALSFWPALNFPTRTLRRSAAPLGSGPEQRPQPLPVVSRPSVESAQVMAQSPPPRARQGDQQGDGQGQAGVHVDVLHQGPATHGGLQRLEVQDRTGGHAGPGTGRR